MIYYVHVNIVLDFPITYRNGSVLCQSKCACLHRKVNMVVFFTPKNGNIYPKGRALMQMYGVVPQTKRENRFYRWLVLDLFDYLDAFVALILVWVPYYT